jgi:pyruvate dehydrogenase E1 component alpha subunit
MNIRNSTEAIERLLGQYETMLQIRLFEEKLDQLFAKGLLGGTCHLCIGQEAAAVGVISQLIPGDKVISSHRGHGHIIAMGGDLERLFGELMERENGYCLGRGGTQHLAAADIGFYGTNGITGGGLPIATGLGLASQRDGNGNIVVSFFGDGAANQGAFHESLNMASVWDLPVLYVCENNLYAMSTPMDRTTNIEDISARASSYGIKSLIADGNQISDVEEKAIEAIDYIRTGKGPVLFEIKTYRHLGHSKSDNRAYRTRDEEELWLENDCIKNLVDGLKDIGFGDRVDEIQKATTQKLEDALQIAEQAPFVSIHSLPESTIS